MTIIALRIAISPTTDGKQGVHSWSALFQNGDCLPNPQSTALFSPWYLPHYVTPEKLARGMHRSIRKPSINKGFLRQ